MLLPVYLYTHTGNEGERFGLPPLRLHHPDQGLPLVEDLLQECLLAQLHAGIDFNGVFLRGHLQMFHVKRRSSHSDPYQTPKTVKPNQDNDKLLLPISANGQTQRTILAHAPFSSKA